MSATGSGVTATCPDESTRMNGFSPIARRKAIVATGFVEHTAGYCGSVATGGVTVAAAHCCAVLTGGVVLAAAQRWERSSPQISII